MQNFIRQFHNAKTAIQQIRAGEWKPRYNGIKRCHLAAYKDDMELWIGNGAWFCEIKGAEGAYLGLFWRHYVWWAAARKLKRDADKRGHPVPILQ